MRTTHWLVSATLALSAIAVIGGGCADSTSSDDGSNTPTGSGGSTTSLASSGGAGGSGGGSGGAGAGICAFTSAKAEPVTLDLIVVLDRSESMDDEGKWEGAKEALSEFFEARESAGMNVGMLFFPTYFSEEDCSSDTYEQLVVPIAPLPDNAFNLTNAFPPVTEGTTPSPPALVGALRVATARQDANPTHKVAVLFATDGNPCCCPGMPGGDPPDNVEDIVDAMAHEAESARKYNGVRTYTVGVKGANMKWLDEIAAAGGTEHGYDVTGAISELQQKLVEVRKAALGCEFALPPPPGGEELVPDLVNFTYTPGGTNTPITLPRADSLADCGDTPGWYYDNNVAPQKILLCPASCATVANDEEAAVAAAFGCQSVLN